MFGDGLLVCPARSTDSYTRLYLPEGGWYRFSNDEAFVGGKDYHVASPLSDLPVFAREGAIIPMQNTVQNTTESAGDTLKLHVFAGVKPTQVLYYEDDGTTYEYEKMASYERTINFDPTKNELNISEKKGSFNGRFKKVCLILHGFDTINSIRSSSGELKISTTKKTQSTVFDWSDSAINLKWKFQKSK